MTAGFRVASDARAALGESPVWRAEDRTVWWVDIEGRRLLRTGEDGATRAWDAPQAPGFVQLDEAGRPVVGMETGVFDFDEATGRFSRLAPLAASGMRFNDACVDAAGRLWAGTMDLDNARDNGVLYVIGPDGALHAAADGFRTVNGLAWDVGRGRLFVSDSHPSAQTIWTLAAPGEGVDFGGVERAEFARLHDLPGRPDGAAMDAEGHYWIAGVGGGELCRYAPDGALAQRLATPVEHPTKPVFTGADLGVMHLTSKRDDGDGGRLVAWGAAAVGVTGAQAYRWRRG